MNDHQRADRYLLLLDLDWDATTDDVTRSYRELAYVWHPDRFERPRLKRRATQKLQQLNDVKDWLHDHLDELRSTHPPDLSESKGAAGAGSPRDRWRTWAEQNGRDPDHRSYTPEPDNEPRPKFRHGIISETVGIPNFLLLLTFFATRFGGLVAAAAAVLSFAALARIFVRWTTGEEQGKVLVFHAAVFGIAFAIWWREGWSIR